MSGKHLTPKPPDVILRDEPATMPQFSFQEMQRMAASIAKSGLFGMKDADQALALMLISAAENKNPALVARDYEIIQGRPAKKAEAILRDFQSSGGRVEWHSLTDELASATFSHPASVKPIKIDWDMARAKKAGLMDKTGSMYLKYPRQMLRARCVSEGCRTIAPHSTSGFYTVEEVQQIIESDPPKAESVQGAIDQSVASLSEEDFDRLKDSMDVSTLPELESRFAECWRATKDAKQRAAFKSIYDSMKAEIAEAAARGASGEA